jgi:hypothetical protein
MVPEWAVLKDSESLFLNYYGASGAETQTPGGTGISILQETDYPESGKVRITLSLEQSERFKLKLRIPTWSEYSVVMVNGKAVTHVTPGTYLSIHRKWRSGDEIRIIFDMSLHYWLGEEDCEGKTSIYHGPVLLAVDGEDIEDEEYILDGTSVNGVVFEDHPDYWLYGRVSTITGEEVALVDYSGAGEEGSFYRSWLKVADGPDPVSGKEGTAPVWNRR